VAIEWQIRNATVAAENYIGCAIGVQTLEWRPEECAPSHYHHLHSPIGARTGPWGWRGVGAYFVLPRPPLVSVTSLKYLDSDGTETTYDAANYIVSGVGREGRITLKSTATWPTVGDYPEPLRIRYVAGYVTVPEPIVQAVLLDAAEAVANTSDISALSSTGAMRAFSLRGLGPSPTRRRTRALLVRRAAGRSILGVEASSRLVSEF
jgi:hypothetical protein